MAIGYVLYNLKAGDGSHRESLDVLNAAFDDELEFIEISHVTNYGRFLEHLEEDDYIILAGGDGTLNRFINDTEGLYSCHEILYYPLGSGNDFARDLGKEWGCQPFPIRKYLKDLPTVTVNGKTYRFLNGVGYGIDGYCCQVGDALRKQPGKKVNYTAIAIKGLLFHYKSANATVTVDGVTRSYQKVWLAPTMHGRFYGGGMMPTPHQDRLSNGKMLSTMVVHSCGKLKTLMLFPSIFTSKHVKKTRHVDILVGKQITVEFDRPTALQIDGEMIPGVTSYTAKYD